ncbi:tyrosine-type recombinase/integrase [Actinomadura mexicana]|uniref:Site-specific recombinase XerD n=1 Tax=Actinomadura mexicana TaxID=134959 RepID=A0A239ALZ1_9ACTN|nr:site-specific integrase [Actinomadura mexicana]SNR96695.1 Site-specific recombinase XerD [Actinomadura mexicana]
MAVYDRWHTNKPRTDEQDHAVTACREHKLFPSKDHGKGDRWQVRWRDEAGKQCKQNFARKAGKDPKTCADAFDAKVRTDLDAGTYMDPARGKILLEDFARQWRSGLTGDPNTLWNVDKRLAHIIDVRPRPGQRKSRRPVGAPSIIGKQSMTVLAQRPSLVQQWIKSLEGKGLSPGYIKRIFDTLSTIFRAAMEDGIVDRNPTKASSVKPPRVAKKKIVSWTLDQVESAAVALGDNALMVYLGVGAGLRQGEIFGLAVDDLDFLGNRVIHVRRQVRLVENQLVFSLPNGDKERDVPLPNSLALRASAHIAGNSPVEVTLPWKTPDGPPHTARLLVARSSGRPHHGSVFNYTWHLVRRSIGVPETPENGMHVLRHTAASAWLAAGVDVRTVAEYLGHADPGFTLRTYAHLMPDAADRARLAMDQFFDQPGKIGSASALNVPSQP